MDTTVVAALIGLGQFVVALLIWFRIKPEHIAKSFAVPTVAGNKLILILLIGGFAFSSYAFYRTLQQTQLTGRSLLYGWGADAPVCHAAINTAPLWRVKGKYDVAIACGLEDSTIDKSADKRISVSALFNIQNGSVLITTPYRPEMADAIQKQIDATLKRQNLPPGTAVTIRTWYELILLPKGTDPDNIHRLSDVPRYGGRVISPLPLGDID